jgi:hypothetical protein
MDDHHLLDCIMKFLKKDIACLKLDGISKCLWGGILWWVVKVTTIHEDLAKFGYKLNMK